MRFIQIPASLTPGEELLFAKSHLLHLLDRITITSIILILFYPYFFYTDFVLMKNLEPASFRYALIAIHIASLLLSIVFLVVYRISKYKSSFLLSIWPAFLINTYTVIYIFIGVLSSINSQSLTGNIDAYAIILISVAVVLPLKPRNFLIILLGNHTLFLVLLSIVSQDRYTFLTKQINTTAAAVIAFFIAFTFYNFRKKDFFQHLKLKENENNFRKLFIVNPYPLVLSRIVDDRIILINPKAIEFFHISPDRMDTVDSAIIYLNEEEKHAILQELMQNGSIKNHVCELHVSPHTNKWVMINYELLEYDNEKCVLAGITDITEMKKMEIELTKHASIDALCGVMNRRYGMKLLQHELAQAQKQGTELIVCFVDINNLKEVNDQYGHAEGDELILIASQVLKTNLDQKDFLFRFGGDEFIIVFHKTISDVYDIWDRIQRELNDFNQFRRKPFTVSVSYGLYRFQPGADITVDEMIELADKEMYQNKRRYKNSR